ncbi:protein-export membrane protein SecF [Virgisporangium aliadipatigenens]|uniref:Protein-export membrane protein SecF n=1 Tax=Virgisporangium aliadipatigenens TaxID=741659 RepID=A0A8J3YNN6_9ACTN|nr:protein translocase subunit SecF [Virgisporangium aliadipatigenens]GIJ47762.1 protein-export membrane protein SecF [Virgisporangium aliadipatigenens]
MGGLRRLYRGETNINFIGTRKRWYAASLLIVLVLIGSMAFKGFHLGVEFAGGSQFVVPVQSGTTVEKVREAVESEGITVVSAQTVGTAGKDPKYLIRTPKLDDEQREKALDAIVDTAKVSQNQVTATEVSSSWGSEVTERALLGLAVFLVLVAGYLWVRFERQMALAAIGALIHDLILTAGVYSLSGFEVSPSTVIGLLTILGFSLYDTVVVFDKVEENTRGLLGSSRQTYAEAANTAVNQTLMRSINTSVIALLPVAGLLFVGAGLLGVGTLKDLALVLFVGLAAGAYSSMFLATPWLVDFKLLDSRYKLHTQRVLARRAGIDPKEARKGARATKAAAKKANLSKSEDDEVDEVEDEEIEEPVAASSRSSRGGAPRPGGRPGPGGRNAPRKRQGGKRR